MITSASTGSDPCDTRIVVEDFGRDHDSLLLYIETRCVDHAGQVKYENLRCNEKRHGQFVGSRPGRWNDDYTTRLRANRAPVGHDDWDCIEDLCAAGLLVWAGTGLNPVFIMTPRGWERAHRLRRERADLALQRKHDGS